MRGAAAFLAVLAFALAAAAPARATRTALADANGNMHAFLVGGDGRLFGATSTSRGVWQPFQGMGGSLFPGRVAVGLNVDRTLEVFARGTDNALWHIRQTAPGGAWGPWESLGGQIVGAPDVAPNRDGRLEVFARGLDNALWHAWQTTPGGSWSGWGSLGGTLSSDPAVMQYSTQALVVWARASDNSAAHIWQSTPGGAWSAWGADGGGFTSAIAPGLNFDGRQEVFGSGFNNVLYHRWQVTRDADWNPDWVQLPGIQIAGDPSVAQEVDDALHVFARGADNGLWHRWQAPRGGAWSNWASLGGQFSGDPIVVSDGPKLQVFALGADGALFNAYETGGPGEWSGLISLGRPADPPAAPPVTPAAPRTTPLRSLSPTLTWSHTARRKTTRLRALTVHGVPKGGTVEARCAKGCSTKRLIKRKVKTTTVSLSAMVRKPLKVGTKIDVIVSAPGAITSVKTLKIRSRKAPSVSTRCLPPGAARPVRC